VFADAELKTLIYRELSILTQDVLMRAYFEELALNIGLSGFIGVCGYCCFNLN
jgi:hypothetical protein